MKSHEDYPVEIDLGREEQDAPVAPANSPSGKKGKTRKYYPTLYIDSIAGMPALPKEGCIMIKYRRKRLSVDENDAGKETTGQTLEIRRICLPEDMTEDDGDDISSAMKSFAKENGVADADASDEDEEESDDEGEE